MELDTSVALLRFDAAWHEARVVLWLVVIFEEVEGGSESMSFCCFGVRERELDLLFWR